MASRSFCYLFRSKHHHADSRPSPILSGWPYATVTMSCLSVNSVYNIGILWPNGWMNRRWRADWPRPRQQCFRWGLTDSASPTGSGTAVGGVSGVVTVSQLMQPCDSKWLKIALKKWSTSNKRKAKGADLQILTSCHCDLLILQRRSI